VTEKEQDAVLLAASVAVQVTVVVPSAKVDPEAGAHTTLATPHASVASGVAKPTSAVHCPGAALTGMLLGHVIDGAVTSATVTVKVHVAALPPPSVAVQVTVVVPTGKVEPDAGTHATVAVPQSSVAVGVW
jgi:hypothetical protein